jgi:hypothetical protein
LIMSVALGGMLVRHCPRVSGPRLELVRTSAAAGDGFQGLAEVVREGVGGGDGLPSGPDLDSLLAGAVALPGEFGVGLRVAGWLGRCRSVVWCGVLGCCGPVGRAGLEG